MASIEQSADNTKACDELLEEAKGLLNYVIIVGLDENCNPLTCYTAMPNMVFPYLEKVLSMEIAEILMEEED